MNEVQSPPGRLNLDGFYTKYLDAEGIPIKSSRLVPDEALHVARDIVVHMLAKRSDIRDEIMRRGASVAIIAKTHLTTDTPEHADLDVAHPLKTEENPEMTWGSRTRGVGGTVDRPTASCGEENLLLYPGDVYHVENILVHEFGHSVYNIGILHSDAHFVTRLGTAYKRALSSGLWNNTYAATHIDEYWAEGVQNWFDCNGRAIPSDGIHNHIHTRAQLKEYDSELYTLLSEVFPNDDWRPRGFGGFRLATEILLAETREEVFRPQGLVKE